MSVQTPTTLQERTGIFGEVAQIGNKPNPPPPAVEPKDLPIVADVRIYMRKVGLRKVRLFTLERMIKNKKTIERDYQIEFSPKSRIIPDMGERVSYNPLRLLANNVPQIRLRWRGMAGEFLVNAGTSAILVFLQALLLSWLNSWTAKANLNDDFEHIRSQIANELLKHRGKVAAIQSRGKQAYANVLISVGEVEVPASDARIPPISGPPKAKMEYFDISENDLQLIHKDESDRGAGVVATSSSRTFSFEVSVSSAEVSVFREFNNELLRWDRASEPAIKQLGWEYRAMMVELYRSLLVNYFGPLVLPDVVDEWMCPKFPWRAGVAVPVTGK
jgi:hypothetical protein